MDYIASCNGKCTEFNAVNAKWTKLAEAGIDMNKHISHDLQITMQGKPEKYFPSKGQGLWAMEKMGKIWVCFSSLFQWLLFLVEQGSKWDIRIPRLLKAGEYLLRHEIVAVHNPLQSHNPTTGPQHCRRNSFCPHLKLSKTPDIACIQLHVSGNGTQSLPHGTKSSELYSSSSDYAKFNVYTDDIGAFYVPGPEVWSP